MLCSAPRSLALTIRRRSSTRKKRRFSRTPQRPTASASTESRRVPLTGAIARPLIRGPSGPRSLAGPTARSPAGPAARSPAGPSGRCLLCPVTVQPPVCPLRLEQLAVAALLDDPAVLEHDDPGRPLDRREPMGDHDRRAAGQQPAQSLLDHPLGPHVHVRGGLV